MQIRISSLALHLIFGLTLLASVSAFGEELKTADEIDACYRANTPQSSSIQTVSMNSKDRIGAITTSKATLYWQKFDDGYSKLMMKFFKPADLRDAALLMLEKKDRSDMFIYLPELRRVKRVTSRMTSSSLFGTDFSYEEFERLQHLVSDASSARLEDDAVNGREAYVLESHPSAESDSAYERIKTWIDKETCVALRSEFYEKGDKPRKAMSSDFAKVTREDSIWVPREVLMQDFRDETETTMVIEEVELGTKIPKKTFATSALMQSGR